MDATDNFTRDHRPRCEAVTGSGHRCRAASHDGPLCRLHAQMTRTGFFVKMTDGSTIGGVICRPPTTARG
jgi:hypothetical protein